ncbi:hypothetical protein BKA01_008041 [Pseudonocardia eucalypti]|uniref:hypothetical protein n=1 Tax=Pseudonocardia eucalypti TaxID=648755 RepID=UPI0017C79BBF|nr:hypothetical protein [Pseudonocardia eucalypti]MBB6380764.1 hypothetical protein [Pseudonocardia eucalypti]
MIRSNDDDQVPEYQRATALLRRLSRFNWLFGPVIFAGFFIGSWAPALAPGADNTLMRALILSTSQVAIALGALACGATMGVAYVVRLWALSHARPARTRGARELPGYSQN